MGVWKVQAGETVFVRAIALEVGSDAVQLRIEDHPFLSITLWVPASEVVRAVDIPDLRPPRWRPAEAC